MLLTSLNGHKLQFIFHKLRPLSSSPSQLCELFFFPRTEALIFLKRHARLFIEYCEIFKTPILKNICELLLLYSNHKVTISIGHLFLIKNMTWDGFYWGFVDLVRVYSLLIVSRNHSNTFLLPDLQKNYLMSILMTYK